LGFPNLVDLDDVQELGKRHPIVVIANEPDELLNPAVFIRTAQPGLHSAGTIIRFDGVPLPLRRIVDTSLPTVEDILKTFLAELGTASKLLTPGRQDAKKRNG
jgi:formylmethanofuran dehydrogenase subunit B